MLSRDIASLGIYPAVDPLDSSSRMMDPRIVGEEHYSVARSVQKLLQDYKSLQDIIAILGMDELFGAAASNVPLGDDPDVAATLAFDAVPRRRGRGVAATPSFDVSASRRRGRAASPRRPSLDVVRHAGPRTTS